MSLKDPRLVKIEEDFPKLEKILRGDPIKETKRLSKLKACIKLYSVNTYSACIDLYTEYGLDKNRYPDIDIIKELKQKIYPLLKFFPSKEIVEKKSEKQLSLFGT